MSASFGPRGAKFTIGPTGKRVTVGIPGTGLFYTTKIPSGGNKGSGSPRGPSPSVAPPDVNIPHPNVILPEDPSASQSEQSFLEGCRAWLRGEENSAYECFKKASSLADGAFLAGALSLKRGDTGDALHYLKAAVNMAPSLGKTVARCGISPSVQIHLTDEIEVQVDPDLRGVLLALVEVYQRSNCPKDAINCLRRLQTMDPTDLAVKVSLCELLLEEGTPSTRDYEEVKSIVGNIVDATSNLEAALLLYKARALRALGFSAEAIKVIESMAIKHGAFSGEILEAMRLEYDAVKNADTTRNAGRQDGQLQRSTSPEQEELDRKSHELKILEEELAERELELATLKSELESFRDRYARIVGIKYIELDTLESRIAEEEARRRPNDANARRVAEEAKGKARNTEEEIRGAEAETEEPITPTEDLKKIYRKVVKQVHPDLASGPEDFEERSKLLREANDAFRKGDVDRLQAILQEWQGHPQSVEGEGIGAELIRVIRKIARVRSRLEAIRKEIAEIEGSDLFSLMHREKEMKARGKDLLAEIAVMVDRDIGDAKARLTDLLGGGASI